MSCTSSGNMFPYALHAVCWNRRDQPASGHSICSHCIPAGYSQGVLANPVGSKLPANPSPPGLSQRGYQGDRKHMAGTHSQSVHAVAASPCCRDGVTCSPSGRSTTRLHEFFATCRPPVRTGGMGWWVLNDDGDRGWVAVASRVHL